MAQGIKDNTGAATEASGEMMQQMLEQMKQKQADAEANKETVLQMLEQMKQKQGQQQEALTNYAAGLKASAGLLVLNTLIEKPVTSVSNVTVNNKAVADMIAGMTEEMKAMREHMSRMKVVLDSDKVIGEISTGVGEQLAMDARRW